LGDVESGAVAGAAGARVSVLSGVVLCVIGVAALVVALPALMRYGADDWIAESGRAGTDRARPEALAFGAAVVAPVRAQGHRHRHLEAPRPDTSHDQAPGLRNRYLEVPLGAPSTLRAAHADGASSPRPSPPEAKTLNVPIL
jgi:hypothetical protein